MRHTGLLLMAFTHILLVTFALHPVPRRPAHTGGRMETTRGNMLDISTTRAYTMAADSVTIILLTTFVFVSVLGLALVNSGHDEKAVYDSEISTGLPVPASPCEDFASLALTAHMATNHRGKTCVPLSRVRTGSITTRHTPAAAPLPPATNDVSVPTASAPMHQQTQPRQPKTHSNRTTPATNGARSPAMPTKTKTKSATTRTKTTPLVRTGSDVVMTFGTDRPEVYLSMLRKRLGDNVVKCACPCKRHSPPFGRDRTTMTATALALSATTKDMRLPASLCTSSRESSTRGALSSWGLSDDESLLVGTATTTATATMMVAAPKVALALPRAGVLAPGSRAAAKMVTGGAAVAPWASVREWDGSDVGGGNRRRMSDGRSQVEGIPDDAVAICVAETLGGAGLTNRRRNDNGGGRMGRMSGGTTMIEEGVVGANVQGDDDVQGSNGTSGEEEVNREEKVVLTKDLIVGNGSDGDVMMMRLQTHCRHEAAARSSVLSFVFAFLTFLTSLFHNTIIAGRPMVVRTFDHY